MPTLPAHIERLAQLTQHKDRDAANSVLAKVLLDVLGARAVRLSELAGDLHAEQSPAMAMLRVSVTQEQALPRSISAWQAWNQARAVWQGSPSHQAASSGETVVQNTPVGCTWFVPVSVDGGLQRLLEIDFDQAPDDRTHQVVEGVVAIYRNFLNLLDYSERDTLTALLNRKSFDETFYRATQHVSSGDEPASGTEPDDPSGQRHALKAPSYWLAVIDIDHFKRVNDGYGHLIGDEVLLLVAGLMRQTFRLDDQLYRFGGEEFVVLLRADDTSGAEVVFERFRINVERHNFPQVGRITVSIGYTQLRDYDTPTSAFERADKAVYVAKSSGRNQVLCYEKLQQFGEVQESEMSNDVELF
jgi:diguanylate cyclase (GGDEF)-like protein